MMRKPCDYRRRFNNATRLKIFQGTGTINGQTVPAVVLYDHASGVAIPIAPEAAYHLSDQLVDTAERMERQRKKHT